MAQDKEEYDLLIEMRKATRRSHNIANALILSKLVVVLTDKGLYARALSSFLPVYSKLEALLQQHKKVPGLSTVVAVTSTIPARKAAMEQVITTGAATTRTCALRGILLSMQSATRDAASAAVAVAFARCPQMRHALCTSLLCT
jgi:hypothetical protein